MNVIKYVLIAVFGLLVLFIAAGVFAMWRHDKAVERRVKEFHEEE